MPTYRVRYAKGAEGFEQSATLSDDGAACAFGRVLTRHFEKPHRGRHLFAGWLLSVMDSAGRAIWEATIWPGNSDNATRH